MTALSEQAVAYQRAAAGLPEAVDPTETWWRRRIRSPYTWAAVALLLLSAACFVVFYYLMRDTLIEQVAEVTSEVGQPQELTKNQYAEAFWMAARLALPTLAVYVALFFAIDRLRPTSALAKLIALAWGGSVSVLASLELNTWMGTLVGVQGAGDPGSGDRTAIFVAPFVEEMAKCTIVFLLAIALRYRLVTPLQTIPLAGLSAVGFAFTENILYYSRIWIYTTKITGQNPAEMLHSTVMARGLFLSWGHPLFTSCVAIGLIIGIRQQSKLARILCPLAGFLMAATGHMMFNGLATVIGDLSSMTFLGVMLLLSLVGWLLRQLARERSQLAWRLDDYVRAGYLTERDPLTFCLLKNRAKLWLASLLRGWRIWRATSHFIGDLSELAYLRSATIRGLVDEPGIARERELLFDLEARRPLALTDVEGLRVKPETWTIANMKARVLGWLPWTRNRGGAIANPVSSGGGGHPVPAGRYPAPTSMNGYPPPTARPGNNYPAPMGR
ncbi:MAG: PrsW family intramembrane metalloprotease [Propionibacteriaceae bacterium]|nr:PrsW family intramembrane metalloprotease [Propionibacteriaceae bacterium]